ncbi:MAG: NAD(P)-dependent oxidoreductase [Enterococcus sp.]
MKILVIGATGRTGREIVKQSLAKNYEVRAYVRRSNALPIQDHLELFIGELNDHQTLTAALRDVDAVLMAIGSSVSNRNAKLFEWVIPSLIQAMKTSGVKRFVSLSALGVGATFANTRYPYRFGARTFLKGNFADHLAGEIHLKDSGLVWTTIHPGPLSVGEKTKRPQVLDAATGFKMPRAPRTRRADVAQVMLQVLNDSTTYEKELIMTSIQEREK